MDTYEQVDAATTLQWFGHASFILRHEGVTIYIDPWKLPDDVPDADLVLVSHTHYDHYSAEDIARITGGQTQLIGPKDVINTAGSGRVVTPGETLTVGTIQVTAVPAYNPDKEFHPKNAGWVGFIVELDGKRLYYAGDTGLIEEMNALGEIDMALLPVGGTYTLDASEAAEAAGRIQPALAVPYHWGDIVGDRGDAETFAELCPCEVRIMGPGQTIALDE